MQQAGVARREVLVIGDRREDFDDLAGLVRNWPSVKIRRAHGAEDVRFLGGGGIRFFTIRQVIHGAARGRPVDHLHLPLSALGDAELIHEVRPCIATRRHGSITFYTDRR